MTYFLDASALVKRYVKEPGSEIVRQLVRKRVRLAASIVSSVEVPAALFRRARQGDLAIDQARRHAAQVMSDLDQIEVVEVRAAVLDLAADLVSRHPLRAYDAIQLASALRLLREGGLAMTFVCADRTLCAAASAEGLKGLIVG